jgi:beta-mannosidase
MKFLFVLLFVFLTPSYATRIPLTGVGWTITDNENYTAQGSIPGTIHTILFAAKQIPEPYLGYNDVDLRYLVRRNWVFTKNFSLTPEFLASHQITIHFEQIDTVANITINSCPIGKTNSMFIPYTFNVASSCLHADNQLQIDFESPVIYAFNQSAAYNDTVPPLAPPDSQHGEGHVQFMRKEPCSFSWDWVRI